MVYQRNMYHYCGHVIAGFRILVQSTYHHIMIANIYSLSRRVVASTQPRVKGFSISMFFTRMLCKVYRLLLYPPSDDDLVEIFLWNMMSVSDLVVGR